MKLSTWPGSASLTSSAPPTVLHVRRDGSPCKCLTCEVRAGTREGAGARASARIEVNEGTRADLVARVLSMGEGSEREQRAAAVAAFVDWIEPLPTALMVTVAPEPVYGLKGYRGLLDDVVFEAADLGRVLVGQVGALAFTQENARGGLHLHGLVWGPEELREVRRVTLARTLEQRWREEWHAEWVGEQRVRVSVVPCTDRGGMHRYAVRYASRDTDGNMIEAGAPMERWVRPVMPGRWMES